MTINLAIFKANDVRGRYPEELNETAAGEIARALAEKVFRKGTVVVAHDARLSSPALYAAVIKAFKFHDSSFKLHEIGLSTTPMFYFLVNELKAAGGIMITASHNPKEYNGMKAVGPKAAVISGEEIWELIK